jgi:ATP-binding cassette subfamily B protein
VKVKNRQAANPKRTLKRLLRTMFGDYKGQLLFVVVMILLSAFANVRGSLFLQVVIDDHITPLLGQANPDFGGLFRAIVQMAIIYLIGILAALIYNFMMVKISEGTQKKNP